jgi:VanZ like family
MNPHRLAEILRDYAGFWPGIAASLAVSLMACTHASRALRVSRIHGWALLMSVGVILSATITPSREALLFGAHGSGTCDLSTFGPGTWWELSHLDDTSLNILLFAPLGLAIGLCPRSRAKLMMLAGALLLPVSIELVQLFVLPLGRECQSVDAVDNLIGLVLGLAGGGMAGLLAGTVHHRRL